VASTGVREIGSHPQTGTINLARFFDPGWGESVHTQQMMRHTQAWLFERIHIEGNRLALGCQIFEGACLHRFPDLSFGDALPLVHCFFSVTRLPALTLGATGRGRAADGRVAHSSPRVNQGTGELVAAASSGCLCA